MEGDRGGSGSGTGSLLHIFSSIFGVHFVMNLS